MQKTLLTSGSTLRCLYRFPKVILTNWTADHARFQETPHKGLESFGLQAFALFQPRLNPNLTVES